MVDAAADLPVVMVGQPPNLTASSLLELLASARPDWHADALCREHPEVNFFPGQGGDNRPALAVCARCLVVSECRAWAIEQGHGLHGVWGGTTEQQWLRSRRAAA